ncbi:Alcohol dehydrogenase C-terminal [Trinorchestia longiramus]|nr:Alcohol dehydrogenase C-terminal [Trinorchestia longiramus]
MSTEGKVIRCKAAVAWAAKQPLVVEDIEVAPPKQGEIRVKIVSTGVCRTEASVLKHEVPGLFCKFPIILGHEGAGIVESIGPGVTSVQPGDHVIPLNTPECKECRACKATGSNFCEKIAITNNGTPMEGTSRFTCKGQSLYHFMGCSSFSQYTVIDEISVVKIPTSVPLEKVCLLGCGVSTGYGAAINTAQVTEGSTCAIWGLGGIGLAVALGCKAQKAGRIIGIDINEKKFEMSKVFGVTEFINPSKLTQPIQQVLQEMTDGGCDFTFECIGNVDVMREALESTYPSTGVSVVIGAVGLHEEIRTAPINLLTGRSWKGSVYGGWKSKSSMPRLIRDYQEKKLLVDEFITFTKPLCEINEGFTLMEQGKAIRTVITMV